MTTQTQSTQVWHLDVINFAAAENLTIQALIIINENDKKCLTLEIDTSFPATELIRAIEKTCSRSGLPQSIWVDHSDQIPLALASWCAQHNVILDYTSGGSPRRKTEIELFSRQYKLNVLDLQPHADLDQIRQLTRLWLSQRE